MTNKSGFAIASLVLGLTSFIPLFGVLLGILAIIFGIIALVTIKKNKQTGKGLAIAGIILGILGILFTIVLYSFMFYMMFFVNSGEFGEQKKQLSKKIITQNQGILELYKKKNGTYPENLNDLIKEKYSIYTADFFGELCYKKIDDRLSYELSSRGPDRACNTEDDIKGVE